MKIKSLLFILIAIIFILPSCGEKNEENQEIVKEKVKQDTVKVDTIQQEVVIEQVVEEPVPEWPKMVVVQQDEWIYDIARREYGNIYAWKKIYDANKEKIIDPDIIYPGQELLLPE
jgi:nucleoid-associated protein YgaU